MKLKTFKTGMKLLMDLGYTKHRAYLKMKEYAQKEKQGKRFHLKVISGSEAKKMRDKTIFSSINYFDNSKVVSGKDLKRIKT
jgi:hypothetical protein